MYRKIQKFKLTLRYTPTGHSGRTELSDQSNFGSRVDRSQLGLIGYRSIVQKEKVIHILYEIVNDVKLFV